MKTLRLAAALLLLSAAAACAKDAVPPEILAYYEAWNYLASSSTIEEREQALGPVGRPVRNDQLRKIREAMALIDGMELPEAPPIPNPMRVSRWLRPLARYEVTRPVASGSEDRIVVRCQASLASRGDLFHLADGPGAVFAGTSPDKGRSFSVGIELHTWVRTGSGWRKEPVLYVLAR